MYTHLSTQLSRSGLRAWLVQGLMLALSACAPTLTGETVSDAGAEVPGFTAPTGAALAQACATYRIEAGGVLSWSEGSSQREVAAPYHLDCPDGAVDFDGTALTLRAGSLSGSLARFSPAAGLLRYHADLRVRPDGDVVSADPPGDPPDPLSVTVIQDGQARPLLQGRTLTPVRVNPQRPYTIRLINPQQALPWPVVQINGAEVVARTGQ